MNESDLNDIHVNESEVLDNVFDSVIDSHESDGDDNQVNDRFKKGEGYHAIPPPYTRNYMPPRADLSFAGLDDFVFKCKVSETVTSVPKIETNASKTSKDSLEKPKTVRSSAPFIEEWESYIEDANVFKPKEVKKTVKPSLEKIEFVNARKITVENENKVENPMKFSQSPRAAVLTKSRQVPVNAAKQSSHKAASVSAASGCSRDMTGNKSCLTDYQEINGGFVAFGGNAKGGLKCSKDEVPDDAGKKEQEETLRKQFEQEFKRLFGQEEADNTNSTNRLNTVSSLDNADANANSTYRMFTPISTAGSFYVNLGGLIHDTRIFSGAYDDEVEGAVIDFNNLEPTTVVYRNKKDERWIVVRNKARLVTQGHTQEEGIYYDEVFASVARIEAIMLFLAYASFMGFIVYQMDVKSDFLNKARLVTQGHTQEEGIYYDEVFAPVARIEAIMLFLAYASFMGFIVYQMDVKSDFLYDTIEEEVMQRDDGIFISQDKYVVDILKKFDFFTVKTTSTPIETNKALLKDKEAEDVDVQLYRSMIGSLIYLTASRPNIIFTICACARFQVTPKVSHLHVVKRIFRYLKGKPKLGLWYPKDSPFDLKAFSDSDYARASLDRQSTTEGCLFLGKRLNSWQCKKQTVVANSTTEPEYVVAANCCRQVLWI
uniref:Putative ribonuclease H-like domain-containing protein n=1 Tax=Tanacetum cinerariifolium TaxID=118510 RepID=A0A6L2KGK7_TANCI|nr:putative ribonuclease H-like domain-containing protein [Tanacetum cinerariifolium]